MSGRCRHDPVMNVPVSSDSVLSPRLSRSAATPCGRSEETVTSGPSAGNCVFGTSRPDATGLGLRSAPGLPHGSNTREDQGTRATTKRRLASVPSSTGRSGQRSFRPRLRRGAVVVALVLIGGVELGEIQDCAIKRDAPAEMRRDHDAIATSSAASGERPAAQLAYRDMSSGII